MKEKEEERAKKGFVKELYFQKISNSRAHSKLVESTSYTNFNVAQLLYSGIIHSERLKLVKCHGSIHSKFFILMQRNNSTLKFVYDIGSWSNCNGLDAKCSLNGKLECTTIFFYPGLVVFNIVWKDQKQINKRPGMVHFKTTYLPMSMSIYVTAFSGRQMYLVHCFREFGIDFCPKLQFGLLLQIRYLRGAQN